jgi:light-regulated signal transduction histidine kinase (bacteriophytochrome)
VAGRRWTFHFVPTLAYFGVQQTWHPWAVLAGGLLFTGLLGAFLLVVTGRTATVERLVAERQQTQAMLAQHAQELARSNADLEQFAYVASHDLQEPLRKVANYTELFAQRYAGQLDAKAEKYIGYIIDGTVRMQQLIQDLLVYGRVSRSVTAQECVHMDEIFHKVLATLELTIADTQAEVTAAPLPTVRGNPTQLGQLLQNLIGNALKYRGSAPPRVHITVQRSPREWVFAVRDNGIGLDPQHAERIFGVFQRLHTREEYPGTGIGLAICKKIVEGQGGRIWVEATPGQGATFFFSLPQAGGFDLS